MVEVLVAIVLFAILSTAAVPLLITSLRASVVTKLDTGAKNLTQQRFDLMRNMPFRIAYDPLVVTSRDILDQYYPNLVAPAGGVETKGFVTTQARREGEPASGPFYRSKFTPTLGSTTYTQWVAVQFLSPTTKVPVAPASPYNAFSLNDLAPSTLLGVTVITEWKIRNQSKRYTVYSQIGDVAPATPLLALEGRVTALKVSSTLGGHDLRPAARGWCRQPGRGHRQCHDRRGVGTGSSGVHHARSPPGRCPSGCPGSAGRYRQLRLRQRRGPVRRLDAGRPDPQD